ncbi:MAG: alpha/beta fold hydrolase [Candidatus Moranbacteria bacterium]|nr:alpha/beta fold hydrolase [Candidatus Moranbacteria bacterium]
MIKTILLTAIAAMTISCGNAQENLKMEEKKIKIRNNQVEINYYQLGKGNTTLLFLHGWCIDKTYWNNQINHFSKQYATLAIDLPGFGKSTANRQHWTIEEYAEDVNSLIDSFHLKNVVLIGHSMSGEIMIQTAMLNNQNIIGLIGVDNFKALDVEFTPEQMKQMTDFFPLGEREKLPYYQNAYIKFNIHYEAILSLAYNDKFVGVVSLYRLKNSEDFSDRDIYILDLLKNHLAFRLYSRLSPKACGFQKEMPAKSIDEINAEYGLTGRESEILKLLAQDKQNQAICEELFITMSTLRKHTMNIYRKMSISNRVDLHKLLASRNIC